MGFVFTNRDRNGRSGRNGRMIKNKFYFAVGIFCGICFVIDLVNHRDMFVLFIAAYATVGNIIIGLTG